MGVLFRMLRARLLEKTGRAKEFGALAGLSKFPLTRLVAHGSKFYGTYAKCEGPAVNPSRRILFPFRPPG